MIIRLLALSVLFYALAPTLYSTDEKCDPNNFAGQFALYEGDPNDDEEDEYVGRFHIFWTAIVTDEGQVKPVLSYRFFCGPLLCLEGDLQPFLDGCTAEWDDGQKARGHISQQDSDPDTHILSDYVNQSRGYLKRL